MRVNKVSDKRNRKSVGGRKPKLVGLRNSTKGQELLDTFFQYISAGASVNSAAAILGVRDNTIINWCRKGEERNGDVYEWFVDRLYISTSSSVSRAEISILKSNPKAYLENHRNAKVLGVQWGSNNSDRKEHIDGSHTILEQDTSIKRDHITRDDSISKDDMRLALIELRRAGIDINSLVDAELYDSQNLITNKMRTHIDQGADDNDDLIGQDSGLSGRSPMYSGPNGINNKYPPQSGIEHNNNSPPEPYTLESRDNPGTPKSGKGLLGNGTPRSAGTNAGSTLGSTDNDDLSIDSNDDDDTLHGRMRALLAGNRARGALNAMGDRDECV